MSPVSDARKMSLMPDSAVVRSQSDSSYESLAAAVLDRRTARRPTDWATAVLHNDSKVVLRPLQVSGLAEQRRDNFSSLLYRRLSKVRPMSGLVTEAVSCQAGGGSVHRSYSVKSVKKLAETKHRRSRGSSIPTDSNKAVKERTASNRSLPLPGDESEYFRLRNFSVTPKGVVNRGDSFRSRSGSNIPAVLGSNKEEVEEEKAEECKAPSPLREEEKQAVAQAVRPFKALLIGAAGVGKTAMRKQFRTSEYICAYDSVSETDIDQTINVVLNNEESLMEFEEETWMENSVYYTKPDCPLPDAFVIVYSVTDRWSFLQARSILSQVEFLVDTRAIILVGNKTDLARLRVVTTEEGRSLAKDRGCKFIETSVAINHQVDELLVGTLTQIRMKAKVAEKLRRKGSSRRSSIYNSSSKASGVLKRILRRACLSSKSCDNLHVL